MQYYYECIDIYEKLIPEVKKHTKVLRKLDADFILTQEMLLEACQSIDKAKDKLDENAKTVNYECIINGIEELQSIAKQKKDITRSLLITIHFYMSKFRGYMAEFRQETDNDGNCTSMEIEKKVKDTLRKRLKDFDELREDFDIFDKLLDFPAQLPDGKETNFEFTNVNTLHNRLLSGQKQSVHQFCQDVINELTFQEDTVAVRSRDRTSTLTNNKRNHGSLRIKTDNNSRRGSIVSGTPSPRTLSPRPKSIKLTTDTINPSNITSQPSPSNIGSSVDYSTGQLGAGTSFNYNGDTNSFSTMPSFSGSQESRHGRQRKFTQKAQQMFKENKLGPGRPTQQHVYQQQTNQQLINGSQPRPVNSHYVSNGYSNGLPQNYTYQQGYTNTHSQMVQPQMQTQLGFNQTRNQFFSQQSNVRYSTPNGISHSNSDEIQEQDEDERSWCFCGEKSYGDMVSCDNRDCTYQWFHFPCVGITEVPSGRWFCPECRKKAGQ